MSTIIGGIFAAGLSKGVVNLYKKSGQGDNGFISGYVTELGLPVARRVMCYHRRTKSLAGITTSKADGSYFMTGLVAGVTYYLTSIDANSDGVQYNAVTQDLIVASEVL